MGKIADHIDMFNIVLTVWDEALFPRGNSFVGVHNRPVCVCSAIKLILQSRGVRMLPSCLRVFWYAGAGVDLKHGVRGRGGSANQYADSG